MRARGAKATDIVVLVVAADDARHAPDDRGDRPRAGREGPDRRGDQQDRQAQRQRRSRQEGAGRPRRAARVVGRRHAVGRDLGHEEAGHRPPPRAHPSRRGHPGADGSRRRRGARRRPRGPARGRAGQRGDRAGAGRDAPGRRRLLRRIRVRPRAVDAGRPEREGRRGRPATPVEVTGFEDLPQAGDAFQVVEDEAKARSVVSFRQQKDREKALASSSRVSLEQLFSKIQEGKIKDLPIILKTDVSGSMEVLSQSLEEPVERPGEGLAPPRGRRRHHDQRRAARFGFGRHHRGLQRAAREEGRRGGREGGRRDPPPHRHLQRDRRDQEGDGGPARPDAEGGRPRPRRGAQHLQGPEVRRRRRLLRDRRHHPAQRPGPPAARQPRRSTRARSDRCAASRTTSPRSSRASSAASASTVTRT